jgi:hypothetical protein
MKNHLSHNASHLVRDVNFRAGAIAHPAAQTFVFMSRRGIFIVAGGVDFVTAGAKAAGIAMEPSAESVDDDMPPCFPRQGHGGNRDRKELISQLQKSTHGGPERRYAAAPARILLRHRKEECGPALRCTFALARRELNNRVTPRA